MKHSLSVSLYVARYVALSFPLFVFLSEALSVVSLSLCVYLQPSL
jgi:hypothetical protein